VCAVHAVHALHLVSASHAVHALYADLMCILCILPMSLHAVHAVCSLHPVLQQQIWKLKIYMTVNKQKRQMGRCADALGIMAISDTEASGGFLLAHLSCVQVL
jgi:hypothetical protein